LQTHIDNPTDAHDASAISYDNSASGLAATQTQSALDEIDADLDAHLADVSNPHQLSHDQITDSATTGEAWVDKHHNKSHAHDGVDGSGTVAHSDTTGRTENDHHNRKHNLYSDNHPDVDITNPLALRDGLFWNGSKLAPDRRTRLIPAGFVNGVSYQLGDEVTNGSQISEAIVDGAEESPYIAPIGQPFYVYEDTLTPSQFSAKFVLIGNRVTQNTGGYINGYQIYVVSGNRYVVWIVDDPLGDAIATQLDEFTAAETGTIDRQMNSTLVGAGSQYDLMAQVNKPADTPITFTGDWGYDTPQNTSVPADGEIVHANSTVDQMRISKTDSNLVDRSLDIDLLTAGDIIEGLGVRWTIQAVTDNVTWIECVVAPAVQGTPDGVSLFTFETVAPTDITIGYDLDWWLTSGYTGQGLTIVDGRWSDIVPDNNFYAIQPLFQQAHFPTQWKVKVLSSGGAGSGAGFVPTLFDGDQPGYMFPDIPQSRKTLTAEANWILHTPLFVDTVEPTAVQIGSIWVEQD